MNDYCSLHAKKETDYNIISNQCVMLLIEIFAKRRRRAILEGSFAENPDTSVCFKAQCQNEPYHFGIVL